MAINFMSFSTLKIAKNPRIKPPLKLPDMAEVEEKCCKQLQQQWPKANATNNLVVEPYF